MRLRIETNGIDTSVTTESGDILSVSKLTYTQDFETGGCGLAIVEVPLSTLKVDICEGKVFATNEAGTRFRLLLDEEKEP